MSWWLWLIVIGWPVLCIVAWLAIKSISSKSEEPEAPGEE